jgi:signal transduction histidine kinase
MHDTLGHHLSILNIQLETIHRLHERDPARLPEEIAEARRVAAQSMQEVRNVVAALRPASVAQLPLPASITQLAREFQRTSPATDLTLDLETELPPLPPDVQVTFFRAAQEALTNIRKHTKASNVLLRLRYEDHHLELLILDNGTTLPSSAMPSGGFGLLGLRERVELLGGHLDTQAVQPSGFRLTIQAPLEQGRLANA